MDKLPIIMEKITIVAEIFVPISVSAMFLVYVLFITDISKKVLDKAAKWANGLFGGTTFILLLMKSYALQERASNLTMYLFAGSMIIMLGSARFGKIITRLFYHREEDYIQFFLTYLFFFIGIRCCISVSTSNKELITFSLNLARAIVVFFVNVYSKDKLDDKLVKVTTDSIVLTLLIDGVIWAVPQAFKHI